MDQSCFANPPAKSPNSPQLQQRAWSKQSCQHSEISKLWIPRWGLLRLLLYGKQVCGFAKNRPHAPARRFFSAFLDTESSILFVNSLSDVGEVFAVIENIDAGEIFQYVFDSSKTASLPLSCTCGEWSITLILNGGGEYIGHFYL